MSPVIRVDEEVYAWLQAKAKPFEDTPNSVLRAIAELNQEPEPTASTDRFTGGPKSDHSSSHTGEPGMPRQQSHGAGRRVSGKLLARKWDVKANHHLYHKDGTWYENLRHFPGALYDPKGYVVFRTREELQRCPQITIGEKTNVRPHLSAIRGYVRMER